jgi:hypothetical protein
VRLDDRKFGVPRSCYSVAEEITWVCADYLVELRGFEPLTSAVRAPTRFTAPPLPTRDHESAKFALKSLAGDDLKPQLDRKARDAASVSRTRAPSRQVKAGWSEGRARRLFLAHALRRFEVATYEEAMAA